MTTKLLGDPKEARPIVFFDNLGRQVTSNGILIVGGLRLDPKDCYPVIFVDYLGNH